MHYVLITEHLNHSWSFFTC